MSKEKAILITALALFTAGGAAFSAGNQLLAYDLYADMHRNETQAEEPQVEEQPASNSGTLAEPGVVYRPKTAKDFYQFVPIKELYAESIDTNSGYYPNPTMKSAIAKYKRGNYSGCLQELFAYIKKHPNDAYAFYYMGLSYTKIGVNDVAQKCFQKSINCDASGKLLEMAVKGRDCLAGGPYCREPINPPAPEIPVTDPAQMDPALDEFVNAPYTGHGFSPQLEQEYRQKQLNNMQKTINRKERLDGQDMREIKNLEKNKSEVETGELLAMAADITKEPTDEEVLEAIDVLKRSGINISASANLSSEKVSVPVSPSSYINPEYETFNMMLGNNNSNNDAMMNMLPYMLSSNSEGKNIDPQVFQAVMMNSMMNSLGSLNSGDSNK